MEKKTDGIFCKSDSIRQNSVIFFISRHTSPCKIKHRKKNKLNQIVEDSVVTGGDLCQDR